MSLAPRRPLACFSRLLILAFLAWGHRANAQAPVPPPARRVVVLVVLPSAAQLDASRLRVDIGNELGADVVLRDDPLAPLAVGTLTIGLEASAGGGTVTVRYEARPEPISRQMDLPAAPDAAERATVLLAGNLARDESAELALAVRARRAPRVAVETEDVRHVAPPVEAHSDTSRSAVRFGAGGEPVLWYVPAASTTSLGARAFGRMSVDLTSFVGLHVDFGAGALASVGSGVGLTRETTSIPISLRADLRLNLTRHYAVGLGVDLGMDISRAETVAEIIANRAVTNGGTVTNAGGILGFHVSPLTLRFGQANQFQFAAQEGVLLFLEEGQNPAFEQTLSFTYLFGSPPGG